MVWYSKSLTLPVIRYEWTKIRSSFEKFYQSFAAAVGRDYGKLCQLLPE
jgi:hypothetical protein